MSKDKSGILTQEDRKELAKYCENHGIAAACFVENCNRTDLEQIQKIVRETPNLPELPVTQLGGYGK